MDGGDPEAARAAFDDADVESDGGLYPDFRTEKTVAAATPMTRKPSRNEIIFCLLIYKGKYTTRRETRREMIAEGGGFFPFGSNL